MKGEHIHWLSISTQIGIPSPTLFFLCSVMLQYLVQDPNQVSSVDNFPTNLKSFRLFLVSVVNMIKVSCVNLALCMIVNLILTP